MPITAWPSSSKAAIWTTWRSQMPKASASLQVMGASAGASGANPDCSRTLSDRPHSPVVAGTSAYSMPPWARMARQAAGSSPARAALILVEAPTGSMIVSVFHGRCSRGIARSATSVISPTSPQSSMNPTTRAARV